MNNHAHPYKYLSPSTDQNQPTIIKINTHKTDHTYNKTNRSNKYQPKAIPTCNTICST